MYWLHFGIENTWELGGFFEDSRVYISSSAGISIKDAGRYFPKPVPHYASLDDFTEGAVGPGDYNVDYIHVKAAATLPEGSDPDDTVSILKTMAIYLDRRLEQRLRDEPVPMAIITDPVTFRATVVVTDQSEIHYEAEYTVKLIQKRLPQVFLDYFESLDI